MQEQEKPGATSGYQSDRIAAHLAPRNTVFYRLFPGTRAEAIATLATEHNIWTWVFRGVGFLIMWLGITLVFEPLSVLLDVIPFLGSLSRGAAGCATFLVSLVLSAVTILVSLLLHNPIMVFLALGLSLFALFWGWRHRDRTPAT